MSNGIDQLRSFETERLHKQEDERSASDNVSINDFFNRRTPDKGLRPEFRREGASKVSMENMERNDRLNKTTETAKTSHISLGLDGHNDVPPKDPGKPSDTVSENINDNIGQPSQDKVQSEPPQAEPEVIGICHIANGAVFRGTLEAVGAIEISGRVIGDMKSEGDVTISGEIQGDIEAANVTLKKNGHVIGNICGTEKVIVEGESVLVGDVVASSAEVAGALKGGLDVTDDVVLKDTAIVFGDVRAQSINIAKGAVIKGKCTLNFSDDMFTNFFHKYETLPGLPLQNDSHDEPEVGSSENITPIERVEGEIIKEKSGGF